MYFSELSKNVREKCPELFKAAFKHVVANYLVIVQQGLNLEEGNLSDPQNSNGQQPACSECEKQKTIICQINISSLQDKFKIMINRKDGLFQCFFCLDCMSYDGCFDNIYFVPESELPPDLQLEALKKI